MVFVWQEKRYSVSKNDHVCGPGAAQQTQNICITFVQRRPNVFDVGPTLYKCYTNVLCLLKERPKTVSLWGYMGGTNALCHMLLSVISKISPSSHQVMLLIELCCTMYYVIPFPDIYLLFNFHPLTHICLMLTSNTCKCPQCCITRNYYKNGK